MPKKPGKKQSPVSATPLIEEGGLVENPPVKAGRRSRSDPFFDVLRTPFHRLEPIEIKKLFDKVDRGRVERLAGLLSKYIGVNLPIAIERREGLADYKINPYVLLTCANIMKLEDGNLFAGFLFNTKLYAGLETSFGKSIESTVVGITYGTDRSTNNKENQILVKLIGQGFVEEDREKKPGVLIDVATKSIRVYRKIGKDFRAMIGDPVEPEKSRFAFLEVLMALTKALALVMKNADLQTKINLRIKALIHGLERLMFPRQVMPGWAAADPTEVHLFWFATAMSAFYDEGV